MPNHRCGHSKWLQHPEEGHREDKQVCRSPDWVPETMEQECRGHTSHHRCSWNLQIECQRLWNKKVEVIPVIIGATGIVDMNIKKYLGRIPGCHNIYSLQRLAILWTGHILRKVLSIKPEQTGQDIQHHVSPRCRDYTQENMVKSKNLKIRDKNHHQ